jgi:hypothetical protein
MAVTQSLLVRIQVLPQNNSGSGEIGSRDGNAKQTVPDVESYSNQKAIGTVARKGVLVRVEPS